jgi:hypothetical protein
MFLYRFGEIRNRELSIFAIEVLDYLRTNNGKKLTITHERFNFYSSSLLKLSKFQSQN